MGMIITMDKESLSILRESEESIKFSLGTLKMRRSNETKDSTLEGSFDNVFAGKGYRHEPPETVNQRIQYSRFEIKELCSISFSKNS